MGPKTTSFFAAEGYSNLFVITGLREGSEELFAVEVPMDVPYQ